MNCLKPAVISTMITSGVFVLLKCSYETTTLGFRKSIWYVVVRVHLNSKKDDDVLGRPIEYIVCRESY